MGVVPLPRFAVVPLSREPLVLPLLLSIVEIDMWYLCHADKLFLVPLAASIGL